MTYIYGGPPDIGAYLMELFILAADGVGRKQLPDPQKDRKTDSVQYTVRGLQPGVVARWKLSLPTAIEVLVVVFLKTPVTSGARC